MATAKDAIRIARTLLNDDASLVWGDSVLMPKLQQAHLELVQKFALNGLPVERAVSAAFLVTAGSTNLGVNLPTDIISPTKMEELAVNDDVSNTIPMTLVEYIPNLDRQDSLRYWAWINETIQFLGANTNRTVHLYYIKSLSTPLTLGDPLGIYLSEAFLGPRTAALALDSIRDFTSATAKDKIAEAALDRLIRTAVKGQQSLPVRRRPFSYSMRNRRRLVL